MIATLYHAASFLIFVTGVQSITLKKGIAPPKDGDLKLIDGPNKVSGTVMVFRGYAWGRICDDTWNLREANVACRQLNMGYAVRAFKRNKFRSSNMADYMLDDVRCQGNETSILDCKFPGWGKHNCKHDEHAGVQCVHQAPTKQKPKWNRLGLPLSKEEIEKLGTKNFELSTADIKIENKAGVVPVIVEMEGTKPGTVCPDYFTSAEATVVCKSLGKGIGGDIVQLPMDEKYFPSKKHLMFAGRCYGNETSIKDCVTHTSSDGVPCTSKHAIGIKCVDKLPDLIPELEEMQRSSYLQKLRLWHLECAIEEGCLPEAVNTIIERNPGGYMWEARYLLRFSSIIANIGTGAFIPYEKIENWEWHACHMHYHSMKVFAIYNVVDKDKRVIASGHKASFCLEDSTCNPGVIRSFRCSNVQDIYGTQGISPGCKDTYMHDYDCQWVDLTDVPVGSYHLEVAYNPDLLVPESDFFNNGVRCSLFYNGHSSTLRNCKRMHPLDLE